MTMIELAYMHNSSMGRHGRTPDDEALINQLSGVLTFLHGALLVIDQDFRIHDANDEAIRMLGCHSDQRDFGCFIVGGTLLKSQAMRKQARAAIRAGDRTVLMLAHPHHKALICNLRGIEGPLKDGFHALVTLAPLGQASPAVAPFLRDMFGLSRAEAEIALAASSGLEVSQIILQRKVSIHTLRAQIASIKAKMGASRMTEVAITIAQIQATTALT